MEEDFLSQQLYWMNKLSGDLLGPFSFADGMGTASQSTEFGILDFDLPMDVFENILRLTKRSDLSMYAALVSALTILVHKYTGVEDLIVGSPLYNPDGSLLKNDLVPLRSEVRGEFTFKDCLLEMKQTVLEAYSNQDVSFEKIFVSLGLSLRRGRRTVFDLLVALDGLHQTDAPPVSFVPLSFSFVRGRERISAIVKYDVGLFNRARIERIIRHYLALLGWLLQNVNGKICDASLMTEQERFQLLYGFNGRRSSFPVDRTYAELFEQQVSETPDRVAVTCSGKALSYRQLNVAANRMAQRFRALGAEAEKIVAVLADRSIELLISIVASFKSGAAYLPLDTYASTERLSRVISRSGAAVLLLSGQQVKRASELLEEIAKRVAAAEHPQIRTIGELLEGARGEERLLTETVSNSLAYVIYTSGSTGEPKGVMIEQEGMINHLYAKISDLQIGAEDVVGQTASASFDISMWQFLAGLVVGARVSILGEEEVRDGQQLLQAVVREGLSIIEVVPAQLEMVLRGTEWRGRGGVELTRLRWVVVTGEEARAESCRQWRQRYPGVRLMNAYGPTECSDDVSEGEIGELREGERVAIGQAVANMRMYVVGDDGEIVPEGIAGDLYVGGIGVGRGYLRDVCQTVEAYVPDTISGQPGERLYWTGDVVRYRGGGELEWLGRRDEQVKIRGYRVELGEIAKVMKRHKGVKEAVAVLREEDGGEARLIGYVVEDEGAKVSSLELRRHMQEEVAEYQVPQTIVVVDEMPRTANGKLDRRALPAPSPLQPEPNERYVPPRDPVEKELVRIFSQVLNVERVGIHDDFFLLGGHSIAATQMVLNIREAFDVELPLRQLFAKPSVDQLAAVIEELLIKQDEDPTEEQAEHWLRG